MDQLRDIAHEAPASLFAVVDGGRFDDAPALLHKAGLAPRSLFLAGDGLETEKAGPWFVPVDTQREIDALLAALAAQPASFVLWSCPAGEAALYAHLRGINEAVVPLPRDDAPEADEDAPRPRDHYREERALFRHWDPRVLALVLPILDPPQFSRVFGSATQVTLPDEHGGAAIAPALDPPVDAPRGALRLRVEQMEAISARRAAASQRRIASFLVEEGADLVPGLTADGAMQIVRASEPSAASLGITTEQGRARWAYAMMISNGRAAHLPEVTHFIRSGDQRPDDQVKALLDYTASALRAGVISGVRR